jgi:ribosomal protein S12 methylthiotransferase
MNFKMISLGCPKNLVESEYISQKLCDAGHEQGDDGDTVIINTCAFIAESARESIETILEAAKDNRKKIIVTGCLVERYRSELVNLLPEVFSFIGRKHYADIAAVIEKPGIHHREGVFSDTFPRRVLTPPPSSYLKIQEGCNNRCHYCTIPSIRGSLASRPAEDVIQELPVNVSISRGATRVSFLISTSPSSIRKTVSCRLWAGGTRRHTSRKRLR